MFVYHKHWEACPRACALTPDLGIEENAQSAVLKPTGAAEVIVHKYWFFDMELFYPWQSSDRSSHVLIDSESFV